METKNEKLTEMCLQELKQLNKETLLFEMEQLLLSLGEKGCDLKSLHQYYTETCKSPRNCYEF
jgi:hypothetical protein